MKAVYRHTQWGWAILLPLALIPAAILGLATFSADAPWAILLAVAGVLSVVALLFAPLTILADGRFLECRLGVGLIRRRIRLSDIRRAQRVRNKWYYGWGIRLTPHGWLWNVSGLDAVEVIFASGKKFRIGTDEPEKLLLAIRTGTMRPDPSR